MQLDHDMTDKTLWLGVVWKIFSCMAFALINCIVRYLANEHGEHAMPFYAIMFYQNLFGALILLPTIKPLLQRSNIIKQYGTEHLLRIAVAVFGLALWYLSLRYLKIVQVIAISFIAPILTMLGAIIILREKVTRYKILAFILSICAGFFLARPDLSLNISDFKSWVVVLPLLAALLFSWDKILTRSLAKKGVPAEILAFYLLFFMLPFCVLPQFYYGWIWPSNIEWLCLILLGFLNAIAHFSFSKAHAMAEVSILLPFGLVKILLSGLVGFIAFHEMPDTYAMWLGIIIVACNTWILAMQQRALLCNQ